MCCFRFFFFRLSVQFSFFTHAPHLEFYKVICRKILNSIGRSYSFLSREKWNAEFEGWEVELRQKPDVHNMLLGGGGGGGWIPADYLRWIFKKMRLDEHCERVFKRILISTQEKDYVERAEEVQSFDLLYFKV